MSYLCNFCFILVKYDALRVKMDACALSPMQSYFNRPGFEASLRLASIPARTEDDGVASNQAPSANGRPCEGG